MLGYRRWTQRFVIFNLVGLLLAASIVFVIDPLQHYRRATFYRPLLDNPRYYDPGFVRHYDYDCVIVGSSLVANFTPSEVGRKLSLRVLLAHIGSAYAYEEYVLLRTALRTGKARTVIWGLDEYSFWHDPKALKYGPGSMPLYLYDDDPFNDYHYLLNIDVLLNDCGRAIAFNLLAPRSRIMDVDSARFFGDRSTFSRASALRSWQRWRIERPWSREREPAMVSEAKLDTMERSFDANVLALVLSHPEVRYCFFFPPYSVLAWATFDPGRLDAVLDFKRYVYRRFRLLPNVTLFDFQDLASITFDLDKYMDYNHYSPDVNGFIVDAISRNECLVTDDNVEEKIGGLRSQVRRFTDSVDAAGDVDSVAIRHVPVSNPDSDPR